jgi:hypothetical protein
MASALFTESCGVATGFFIEFEIARGKILDQRPVRNSPQHVDILYKHPSTGTVPRKCDVQIFPISHRYQRPVIFHTDHLSFARSLRFVNRYRVTLTDSAVIKFQF